MSPTLIARAVLALSGAVAAFVTLLPAAIAGLMALFDLSAHGVLGISGTLLDIADPIAGSGSGLAPYRGVEVDLGRATSLSLLRGLPPVAMLAIAITGPRRRVHWAWAAGGALLACLTAGWPALPGLVAASIACAPRPRRQIT